MAEAGPSDFTMPSGSRAMNPHRADLEAQFRLLSDEELVSRANSGGLTELAQSVATAEARSRNLALPEVVVTRVDRDAAAVEYHGDMTIVARYLTPTEAHMLCSCLQASGVPAEAGDTHLVQAHSLLTGAVGGACLRVPADFVPEAMEVMASFKRGEFQLGDDFDFNA